MNSAITQNKGWTRTEIPNNENFTTEILRPVRGDGAMSVQHQERAAISDQRSARLGARRYGGSTLRPMSDLATVIKDQFPEMKATLADLVRIPSVSAPGYPPEQVRRSAEEIARLFREAGMGDARLLELDGAHPAVYGSIPAPEGAPTVLLYAHHDVQPPGPDSEWETSAFEPFERDGRLYGRGVSDDKAGVAMHLGTLRAFGGRPPVGLKIFIEGEEEMGSAHLGDYLDKYADLLSADVIVIGDGGNWRVGQPALIVSLRGLVGCVVEVRSAANAAHSGQFGGVFPDAIMSLVKLLATLHTDDGEVAIPGLLADEADPLDLTEDDLRDQLGAVPGLAQIGSGGLTSRLWTKPAISLLAMDVPPIAESINQLVPVARAKVSMRIAPGEDPNDAMNALRSHLLENAPWGVDVTVYGVELGPAFRLSTTGDAADAWKAAMTEVWGVPPVEMGAGGSIPFVADFSRRYPDAALLLTGCGDPTSAIHAPNESQNLDDFEKAILAQATALQKLASD
jgi:acetylornithine deacetylase/succinyl-diaminopimelate desuccinylase-like protein